MDETQEEKSNSSSTPPASSPLKQIRTFQGDVAEALASQRESLVSIQRAERVKQEQAPERKPVMSAGAKKTFSLWLGTLLLLIIGSAVGWYAYTEFIKKTSTPIANAPANRLIAVNAETNLLLNSLTRDVLINQVVEKLNLNPTNTLSHILLQKNNPQNIPATLTTRELFEALDTKASGSLVRSFDPLFMLGALGESSFLIIKLASFENAFAGMLNWEKDMARDIGPLFGTRELLRDIPLESVFIDVTDRNKDVRVLLVENRPALLYSFYDNNMLIITDNFDTLRSLIERLTREKLSR